LLLLGLLPGACALVVPGDAPPPPPMLSKPWMIGVERMQDDPGPRLPFTNRLIADLAGMPNARVVFLGPDRNNTPFEAWQGPKLRVAPWLHGEQHCMNFAYTIFAAGQQKAALGLIVPLLPAGVEPDSACIDRAATAFYQALAIQGL
jgi:hypothetical protein